MEYYGYSNPWGMALQQPMGGLMTPWGLGAMSQPVQPQEATTPQNQRVMGEGGDVQGYGAPGNPNAAAQTSRATKDRFSQGLLGGFGLEAAKTALGTGAALGMGMPAGMIGQAALGGLTSPGTIGGVLGGAINSTLGTKPEGFLGKALSAVPGAALGFTLGPVGGLLGGMFGGVLADGAMDAMDARSNEEVRDSMEDNRGYFSGRTGFADMKSGMQDVNKTQAAVAQVVDAVNKARAVAGVGRVNYSPVAMSMDKIAPGGFGLGGTGSSNTRGGWGGYDPGHASTGFGLGGRAAEVARGALAGVDFGGFSAGGRGGSGNDRGGFGANDGNSDTAGNAGFGR